MKSWVKRIRAVAFDLDGTIYLGDHLVEGALELLHQLKQKNIAVVFFTNNSTKTRAQILGKLRMMGIPAELRDIYTSTYATAVFLKRKKFDRVYCLGSTGLIKEMEEKGISVSEDPSHIKAIVIGLDLEFNYEKLAKCSKILQRTKCKLIACNLDNNYPIEKNMLLPGCGAIVSAVESASGKKVDYAVGKPNAFMLELLAKELRLKSSEILVVGDTYSSDIEMAKRHGCTSILISGTAKKVYNDTIVVKDIRALKRLFVNYIRS
jgi:phosphoglycolate/pyridoxal phosphate phosphatase family enzyme